MEIRNPIPTSGRLTSHASVSQLLDKQRGALLVLDVTSKDESGKDIVFNQYSLFIRGSGGFGKSVVAPNAFKRPVAPKVPNRAPDVIHRETTSDNQAML